LGNRFLGQNTKEEFITRTTRVLLDANPEATLWEPNTQSSHVLIDLTNTNDSQAITKNKFIIDHGDRVYAILAVNRMQEGADWPALERTFDFCPPRSMQRRIQRLGRGTRDYPGKPTFEYYTCLPAIENESANKSHERCKSYFSHLVASMIDVSYYNDSFVWDVGSIITKKQRKILFKTALEYILNTGDSREESVLQESVDRAINKLQLTNAQIEAVRPRLIASLKRSLAEIVTTIKNTTARKQKLQLKAPPLDLPINEVIDGLGVFCAQVCNANTFSDMRAKLKSVPKSKIDEDAMINAISHIATNGTANERRGVGLNAK
jgi:hypothetical protein